MQSHNPSQVFHTHADPKDRVLNKEQLLEALKALYSHQTMPEPSELEIIYMACKSQDGGVSEEDFLLLDDLVRKPDAEFRLAFRLFDLRCAGRISLEDFTKALKLYAPEAELDCKNSLMIKLFFGKDGQKDLSFVEFSQFLKNLRNERLRQAFELNDPQGSGLISAEPTLLAFANIFRSVFPHRMTDIVSGNIATFANLYTEGGGVKISWSIVMAFASVLNNIDTIKMIATKASQISPNGSTFTRGSFENVARLDVIPHGVLSPMETDVIFQLLKIVHRDSSDSFTLSDFLRVWRSPFDLETAGSPSSHHHHNVIAEDTAFVAIIRQMYNFTLGSIAGAFGATVVYPIDLVKTRMQNQRSAVVGELRYKNSWDCFRKVVKNEGFKGLYSGLGPQLVGVAPEKAIKLTMNDLVRRLLTDNETGKISLSSEILAGCIAGCSQVVFTNPLEIVKIRLQVQGEQVKTNRIGALAIVKQLGIIGLYKGAGACLLRDIPFSGIYFTAYAHLKKDFFGESETRKLNVGELLLAGAIAGMPAAYLTTPADVIKTRLQVETRKGQSSYTGMTDAFRKILKEEGARAFFKGGAARVFRSSPQFGVTLMSYELMKKTVPFPWDNKTDYDMTESGVSVSSSPVALAMRNAVHVLRDIDYKFGVVKASPIPIPTRDSK